MGLQRITDTVEALQWAGFRADRGYPSAGMPYPSTPVVSVNLYSSTAREVALEVTVYCSVADGGIVCEDQALEAAAVLEGIGAICQVGKCSFDGKSGLFSLSILARWVEEQEEEPEPETPPAQEPEEGPPTVLFNGEVLPYVTAFSALRSSEVVVSVGAADGIWTLTVEEKIPLAEVGFGMPTSNFTLAVRRGSMEETFRQCYQETMVRRETDRWMYQKRVAKTWEEPIVTFG